jgi:hypothetical protein
MIDIQATTIGKFYATADLFTKRFKVGGNQKLQKILGADILYMKNKEWWWNNTKIVSMTPSELETLCESINKYHNTKRA